MTPDTPAVAQPLVAAGAAQTRTVAVVAGRFNSPTILATGGIAFDPPNLGHRISAPGDGDHGGSQLPRGQGR